MDEGYEAITLNVKVGSETKNAQYYTNLQTSVDTIMNTYQSSNYLEALHDAYEKQSDAGATQQEKEKASTTIDEIKKKIGNVANNETDINKKFKTYNEYKAIKNKTFKSEGVTYYSNGRIQSMTYREK